MKETLHMNMDLFFLPFSNRNVENLDVIFSLELVDLSVHNYAMLLPCIFLLGMFPFG